MLKPTDLAPRSKAPRLAASMIPGPPPVTTTLCCRPLAVCSFAAQGIEFAGHFVVVAFRKDPLGNC